MGFIPSGPEIWVIIIILAIPVVASWRILSKVGYPGSLSLAMLVPLFNLIMLFFLAFAQWPLQRNRDALQEELDGLQRGPE